ncbi:MAG: NAD(P)H-dependent oxidoreductase subunit E [Pleurocapsa minor GSE-CHR-MK-17-07R]|nr:NAD(P)H-dependent oxidoreductase subunit E [Pleurocapsa minor GSE-CHR-MK 17-07R]
MNTEELHQIAIDEQTRQRQYKHRLFVCMGTGCLAAHSDQVKQSLEAEVERRELKGQCQIASGGCQGLCVAGPMVTVEPQGTLYQHVQPQDAAEVIETLDQSPIERLQDRTTESFFQRQTKVVLNLAGRVDPERIEDYIAADGYSALLKALTEMTPAEVIEQITASGLRGRGGAGYPAGLKWSTVGKARSEHKYVICNGDEGDPGAFMDRSVMEDYPHRIIEGMAIAAYAVGADNGYIYVRAEYPLAVKRLGLAIRQAQKHGLLGNNIGGTSFNFHLEIRMGAGAFVCGEETALIASIEGGRGVPRPRPPYPAASGVFGQPTLINNVETFANVAQIIARGSDWFTGIGTEKSKGTKIFALTGKINNSGLIEVPMGITLREIIYDIGGGIPNDRSFKAVQTGGPSGGCMPTEYLDIVVDYESLQKAGSHMGSGGMIVMDETSCMVDVAKYFMEFCMTESCGKCVPCRVGTAQMYDLLNKITHGEATLDDLAMLEKLCGMVRATSLCGLGQGAPIPVLSTLRYFRDEYLAHIVDKHCPAGVCNITAAERTTA